ncbi:MAG: DUF6542 domain-containing protein [Mycobacteriales bacterium]
MTTSARAQRPTRSPGRRSRRPDTGLPGPAAALLTFVVAGIGGVIDILTGDGLRALFAAALIIAVIVAAVVVRVREIWYVVFAPPLICVALAALNVLTTSHSAIDLTAAYLANGFPTLAVATGIALAIGLIRRIIA